MHEELGLLVQCRQLSSLWIIIPGHAGSSAPSGSSFHAVLPCMALGKSHCAPFSTHKHGQCFLPLAITLVGAKTQSFNVTERLQFSPIPTPLSCKLQLAKCQQKLLLLPMRWITLAVKIISDVLLRCLMGLLFKHG